MGGLVKQGRAGRTQAPLGSKDSDGMDRLAYRLLCQLGMSKDGLDKALESLDLSDEKERAIHNFVLCVHEDLCMWRAMVSCRTKDQILEVVEFVSPKRAASAPPRFGVVTWDLQKPAVRWQTGNLTRAQAVSRFNSMKNGESVDLTDEIEISINMGSKRKKSNESEEPQR